MAEGIKVRVSPEEYAEFLEQMELEHIALVSAEVKQSKGPAPGGSLEYEARSTKRAFEQQEDGFTATLHYLVRLREDDREEPLGEIRVAFTAAYESAKPMTPDIFEVFGELNLPLNVYPYVREFVHSTTMRMGFPGLILPTLKRT